MALPVVIEVDDDPVRRMLAQAELTLTGYHLERWLDLLVHPYFQRQITQRFAVEGDAASGPWPPLAPATGTIRESKGFPAEPANIRSGDMFDFVAQEFETEFGADWAHLAIPGAAPNRVMERKLLTAQYGNPDNDMPGFAPTPPRPVLATEESDLIYLLSSLSGWFIAQLVAAGGPGTRVEIA